MTRFQLVSVLLATVGVLNLTFGYGRFPWIAVGLCGSWGVYGLLRKMSGTAAIPGLFFETTALLPFGILYLIFLQSRAALYFGPVHWGVSLILITSGLVTGLPLVWFGHAARHLRLTTIGFLQYLAPSGTFFLGVFLYHETRFTSRASDHLQFDLDRAGYFHLGNDSALAVEAGQRGVRSADRRLVDSVFHCYLTGCALDCAANVERR